VSPSTSTKSDTSIPTYKSLGVRTLVNCMGTYTFLSGSRMVPQAAEAMLEATNAYVRIDELMDKVGERLAELTGAEWGYVTSGAAAAIAEVTCAAVTGGDPEKMARLPETEGMKNEVIMQKAHRMGYDRAIRMAGARIIEVATKADLEAAISGRTAMIFITGDMEERSTIPIPEMIEIAHTHGLPCMVDAAAQRPDVPNRYLEMGADVVAYSGGKCLRGPQSAGLLLGRKDMLKAAFLNAAPYGGLARPMKAGKEDIMGLLAAVESWILGRDHEAEWRMWEGYLETIRQAVADLPSVTTCVEQPGLSNHSPKMTISWDPAVLHVTPAQVHQELIDGDPCIYTHLTSDGVQVNPYMMEAGDDEIAAKRLREILSDRPVEVDKPKAGASPADVTGAWEVDVKYLFGESKHSMTLEQDGTKIEGTYRSLYDWVDVTGEVVGDHIEFSLLLRYETNGARYVYIGTVDGDRMGGEINVGESWSAKRIG